MNRALLRRPFGKQHGIVYNVGRVQPYTVWVADHVLKFCESEQGAIAALLTEERRIEELAS